MARPKKGTPKGDQATVKWKKTMSEKFGGEDGIHEKMRLVGSKGGQKKGVKKGFALNPALAKIAGRKGGKNSSRAGVRNGEGKKREYLWSEE